MEYPGKVLQARRGFDLPAPRIYYLLGAMAAGAERRQAHLARVAGLGFDWVCWAAGGASVPDPPAASGAGAILHDPDTLSALVAEAGRAGLKAMVETRALAPDELARLLDLGVHGLMIEAAWRRRAPEWSAVLAELRARRQAPIIVADALGRPLEEVRSLARAGFEYLINSVAWWDLRERWFLDQHRLLSPRVATLASPEPLRGARLVHRLANIESGAREAAYRTRYLLAATVSSGLVCPMGFEIGMASLLDGGTSRPADWDFAREQAVFDLSDDIARVNRVKAQCPVLKGEGALRRASAPDAPVLALVRVGDGAEGPAATCLLANRSASIEPPPPLADLALAAGVGDFRDALTGRAADANLLEPYRGRLLLGEAQARHRRAPSLKASEQRLHALAKNRVVIERASPEIDAGRFPVKRVIGERLQVEADIFCDGHEVVDAAVQYRAPGATRWQEAPMHFADNDRWAGEFALTRIGRWTYTIVAWRDLFTHWRQDTAKKHDAGQAIALELVEGCELVERYRSRATGATAKALDALRARLAEHEGEEGTLLSLLMSAETAEAMRAGGPRTNLSRYERELEVVVDRPAAAFAAWYEMMPRSHAPEPGRHGTFDDVIARLPYVRDLGFDVLYFTPIHPIGRANRKGRNNSLVARPHDPGSPYAIGAHEGGHIALHPELGDFDAFQRLVAAAHEYGLEIALDFAIQCSPDHPWIAEHPEWFDWRPDGSIKFAENPPKKYEDIVNVHFYRDALPAIWYELRDVVRFWIDKGVKTFRVDNPHTKPVPFWEWMIRDIQDAHPDAVFLSEAFTRPKMMKRLAKAGFTQSYSYFTWRNIKQELTDYLTELTRSEAREYMRPNFFANTPDINPVYLQTGGRAGFQVRLVLAATLSPLYGIYNGFELCEATLVPGKEEYLNSEKYEIKAWDWDRPGHIRDDVALINRIRRENPALWRFANLTFLNAWNDNILAYYKMSERRDNIVIVAVNLDPHNAHGAGFEVPLWELGLPDDSAVPAVDLVEDRRFTWYGKVQHVWLDPHIRPYAIWRFAAPGPA